MTNMIPEEIINLRPLVFLCGPLYDSSDNKDRRKILKKFLLGYKQIISYNHRTYVIEPFALVIDNLFNNVDLEKNQNITLIEEVVAACAYKSYIFVDTMSTALELGLFANSYSQNKTTALLPKDYELFKPSVGYFIRQTMEKSNNITACFYKNKRVNKIIKSGSGRAVLENLVTFKSSNVPTEIEREIKNDFGKGIESFILRIEFTAHWGDPEKIFYRVNEKGLKMIVPPRVLFYLVESYETLNTIRYSLLEYFAKYVCSQNAELIVMYYLIKKGTLSIEVDSPFKYNIEEVVGSMWYFISALRQRAIVQQNYTRLKYVRTQLGWYSARFSGYELFGLTIMEMLRLNSLFKRKRKSVTSKSLVINGKKRKIKMYSNSSEGYELRSIHMKLMKSLQKLISLHPFSYAYRQDRSILVCVNQHIGNKYFIKLDIKDFFNSISKLAMNKILKCHLCDNPMDTYEKNLVEKKGRYKSSYIDKWIGIKEILDICFVKGRLALGMSISPLLSNIYMDFFDARFHEKYPELTYTRYSDDMLISSAMNFNYDEVLKYIVTELNCLGLELNESKERFHQLKNTGDHIKFLGLNIVQAEDKRNYVTVGKKYIKSVCFNISQYEKGQGDLKQSQIIGQVEYIKAISNADYQMLQKLYRVKNYRNLDYDKLKRYI